MKVVDHFCCAKATDLPTCGTRTESACSALPANSFLQRYCWSALNKIYQIVSISCLKFIDPVRPVQRQPLFSAISAPIFFKGGIFCHGRNCHDCLLQCFRAHETFRHMYSTYAMFYSISFISYLSFQQVSFQSVVSVILLLPLFQPQWNWYFIETQRTLKKFSLTSVFLS